MKLVHSNDIIKQIERDIQKLEKAKKDNMQHDKIIFELNKEINHLYKLKSMIENYDY